MSEIITAIIEVRPVGNARASGLVRYPRFAAASRTRSAVSAFTRPGRENVLETVDAATPAAFATS